MCGCAVAFLYLSLYLYELCKCLRVFHYILRAESTRTKHFQVVNMFLGSPVLVVHSRTNLSMYELKVSKSLSRYRIEVHAVLARTTVVYKS